MHKVNYRAGFNKNVNIGIYIKEMASSVLNTILEGMEDEIGRCDGNVYSDIKTRDRRRSVLWEF